jgi:hypothetical protein
LRWLNEDEFQRRAEDIGLAARLTP